MFYITIHKKNTHKSFTLKGNKALYQFIYHYACKKSITNQAFGIKAGLSLCGFPSCCVLEMIQLRWMCLSTEVFSSTFTLAVCPLLSYCLLMSWVSCAEYQLWKCALISSLYLVKRL